jgi:cysteine dioxygenase
MTGLPNDGDARPLALDQLVLQLARSPVSALRHTQLLELAGGLAIPGELIERRTVFTSGGYARNLVFRTPEVELLVLCWRPGQGTSIHDHGGSLNAIRVHSGELTSRLFAPTAGAPTGSGPVVVASEETVGAEGLTGLDRGGIHQLVNLSDVDLVTIHLYAPPLLGITVYSTESTHTEWQHLRYTVADDIA